MASQSSSFSLSDTSQTLFSVAVTKAVTPSATSATRLKVEILTGSAPLNAD